MAEYVRVAKKSEIPNRGGLCVEVGGKRIALFDVDGEIRAVDDTCTHADASLGEGLVEGAEVVCPWHGARFCLHTGRALTPPAFEGVAVHDVRVTGDDVEVEVGSS